MLAKIEWPLEQPSASFGLRLVIFAAVVDRAPIRRSLRHQSQPDLFRLVPPHRALDLFNNSTNDLVRQLLANSRLFRVEREEQVE